MIVEKKYVEPRDRLVVYTGVGWNEIYRDN
jgi:hypothetical protein